jgi:hypothetical protein
MFLLASSLTPHWDKKVLGHPYSGCFRARWVLLWNIDLRDAQYTRDRSPGRYWLRGEPVPNGIFVNPTMHELPLSQCGLGERTPLAVGSE